MTVVGWNSDSAAGRAHFLVASFPTLLETALPVSSVNYSTVKRKEKLRAVARGWHKGNATSPRS
jgi:hypothetical protein